jgi:hypothetical protein
MRLTSFLVLLAYGYFSGNSVQAASSNRNYCISKCFATWSCYDDSSRMTCEQSRNLWVTDCATIPDDPQYESKGAYGAIAHGKLSGAWGLADESPTPEAATKSALGYCEKRGNDCSIAKPAYWQNGPFRTLTLARSYKNSAFCFYDYFWLFVWNHMATLVSNYWATLSAKRKKFSFRGT